MKSKNILLGSVLMAALAVFGCSDDHSLTTPSKAGIFAGEKTALGQGTVTTYEQTDEAGSLAAVGIKFNESVLSSLPNEDEAFTLLLPQKAAFSPFNHVLLDWNHQGHEPPGVYDVPHFDVHFYLITPQERGATIPGPDTLAVPAQFVPPDYFSTRNAVPDMGTHWIDGTAPELNGRPFAKTFIYGFYRGHLTFVEPMITKAYLESKSNVTIDIKQPLAFEKSGVYYPTTFSIKYDAAKKEYSIALDGVRMR